MCLKSKNLIVIEQAGFSRGRFANDQVNLIEQFIMFVLGNRYILRAAYDGFTKTYGNYCENYMKEITFPGALEKHGLNRKYSIGFDRLIIRKLAEVP